MTIDSEDDLLAMRRIGRIVAVAREEMLKRVEPGITTAQLDLIGKRVLDSYGAVSAPVEEYGFPGVTCISVNPIVAHGIPDTTVIRAGDMVNIDVSAELDGYYADTGATVVVKPHHSELKDKLIRCSIKALQKGIQKARAGAKIHLIGKAVEQQAKEDGFTVIRNLCGHGIGRRLHEQPQYIANYFDPRDTRIVKNGCVLAVETFISTGTEYVYEGQDGWALIARDNSCVAQFEHTVVVTKGEPIILTAV